MTVHPIRICGDPVLAQPATTVTQFDKDLRHLIRDLFATNAAANGAGLAANQIGDGRRVFVYDCHDDQRNQHRGYVINPVIETSEIPTHKLDANDDTEGCLSVPGESFPTARAPWAKVTGVNIAGAPIVAEGNGFFARCLQHETDHLNGYLYLDRLQGKYDSAAKRMVKRRGWNEPGNSWMPGTVPDPFA